MMKKSELKEAIKNEITSVLLEGMSDEEREQHIQHLMRTGAKEKPLRKLAAIGKKEDEENLGENYIDDTKPTKFLSKDELAAAIKRGDYEPSVMDKIASFLTGVKEDRIREEDEPTAADLKKKDSVATISNKLQKLTAKMKKKAKEFKEAEGKAKDKIKDELKDMTAEKKKLEKDL